MITYMVSGSGSTEKAANKHLSEEFSRLEKKLSAANVSSELPIYKHFYKLTITPKRKGLKPANPLVLTDTEGREKIGWGELLSGVDENVLKTATKIQYGVEQYLKLTEEQSRAVFGAKRAPAGLMDTLPSVLSNYPFG